jgi:hypothetical protein
MKRVSHMLNSSSSKQHMAGHVQNGTPLFALQELGGWQSPEMVRRYAHLAADHLAPYAQRLSAVRAVGPENDGTNTAQS